jgi:hypothetical protein
VKVKVEVEVEVEGGRGHLPFTIHQSRLVSRRLVGRTSNRATPLPHVITRSEKKKDKTTAYTNRLASYYDITHVEGVLKPAYHTHGTAPPSPITVHQR